MRWYDDGRLEREKERTRRTDERNIRRTMKILTVEIDVIRKSGESAENIAQYEEVLAQARIRLREIISSRIHPDS